MKTGLVIGAASGIGQGIADVMQDEGLMVIRADISFLKRDENIHIKHVDATDEASVIELVQNLQKQHIKIDYLIITIGAIDEGEVLSYPVKSLLWMLEANVLSQFRLIKHLVPLMQKSDSPKILLTGSSAGLGAFDAAINLMPYIISKHALTGFFKSIREELSKINIQVSLLLPHRVKGDLSKNSAGLRQLHLKEEINYMKRAQRKDVDLASSYHFARVALK